MQKIVFILFLLVLVSFKMYSQSKPLAISLGTVKTDSQNHAIDLGIHYTPIPDSLFRQNEIFFSGKKSLFQATPQVDAQFGTEGALSAIELKLSGLFMRFRRTEVAGQLTPCSDCLMHLLPLSVGMETNSSFSFINGILEFGYVPWYQSPGMHRVPAWLKYTKAGVFLQGGYKIGIDNNDRPSEGNQADQSSEVPGKALMRLKTSLSIDTRSLIVLSGIGIGLSGQSDLWYDFLHDEFYYRLQGTTRIYLGSGKDRYFELIYQKGSGAPNFNQGDQFGIGLTLCF